MTLPSEHVSVTPGAGSDIAVLTANGKKVQGVVLVDESGHFAQSLPTYNLWIPGQAVGANKLHWDIFNAAGSGKVMEIRGVWVIPKSDVAVTGALAVEMGLFRTSAVGTGGTAAGYNTGSVLTAPVISTMDTANAAPPAQITARAAPAGGATIAAPYWGQYLFTEETNAGTYVGAFMNLLPTGLMAQRITLREGQGLLCKQGAIASVGTLGALVHFTLV